MSRPRNPRDHIPLPSHQFEILVSLSEGDNHGYRIVKGIKERTGARTSLGASTLYAAIKRMVDIGLIEDAGDRASETSGGPPRRYYRITDFGREVARLEALRMQRAARIVLKKMSQPSHAGEVGK